MQTPLILLAGALLGAACCVPARSESLRLDPQPFGRLPDGRAVTLYTLVHPSGLRVQVMNYGATLVGVQTPDRSGRMDEITLRLDRLEDYLGGHPLLGSVVGRYANRISGAAFTIDGTAYALEANAGRHHIHGGREGLQQQLWDAEPLREADAVGVRFTHVSPDGHAGYPGRLEVSATYRLSASGDLELVYGASTDKPTHVNLTNHVYWNLAGAGSGEVLDHVLQLHADRYLVPDADKIPTGELRPVAGTPLDFREPTAIGARIEAVDGRNYDHCYVLDGEVGTLRPVARVTDPSTGRVLEVWTTQPGVQVYTAKHLGPQLGFRGTPFGPYHGLCLETQHYPDSPNQLAFPSSLLRPGESYRHRTRFRFGLQ